MLCASIPPERSSVQMCCDAHAVILPGAQPHGCPRLACTLSFSQQTRSASIPFPRDRASVMAPEMATACRSFIAQLVHRWVPGGVLHRLYVLAVFREQRRHRHRRLRSATVPVKVLSECQSLRRMSGGNGVCGCLPARERATSTGRRRARWP